jgi:hypothetical protein
MSNGFPVYVYLHRTFVELPMSNGFPPAATWAASTSSASACCVQNLKKCTTGLSFVTLLKSVQHNLVLLPFLKVYSSA